MDTILSPLKFDNVSTNDAVRAFDPVSTVILKEVPSAFSKVIVLLTIEAVVSREPVSDPTKNELVTASILPNLLSAEPVKVFNADKSVSLPPVPKPLAAADAEM